jgi:phosphoglycerate dehydrogenase-like enzyme
VSVSAPRILVAPDAVTPEVAAAIVAGGGVIVGAAADADALVWTRPKDAAGLAELLAAGPDIRWVQLPFAGIEPFLPLLRDGRTWTCGKGVYAEPVAEMALGMLLAGLRGLVGYAQARRWSPPVGRNLRGARLTIVGGGEITRSLIDLLAPWRTHLTVVRRQDAPVPGAQRVLPLERLREAVADADAVVLALALTPATERIVDARLLAEMAPHAWLINVARGRHVDTDALVDALRAGTIAGAALDVTDPEPLPEGHPLWALPNCLITPHTGNTPEMGVPLHAARTEANVARFARGEPLLGLVDADAGY